MLIFVYEIYLKIKLYLSSKHVRYYYKIYTSQKFKQRFVTEENIKCDEYSITVIDWHSFVGQYKEIFCDETYSFKTDKKEPVIVDCGANIGLASLYFKRNYENSKIKAIEADPDISKVLKHNLASNNIHDVEIISKAAWINDDGVSFVKNSADAGSVHGVGETMSIPSISLKTILEEEQSIDLLKIDIEGAENEVIIDCESVLGSVSNLFIEYHSLTDNEQHLSTILAVLERVGFRYYIESFKKKKTPFINNKTEHHMDLQLLIFAHKK